MKTRSFLVSGALLCVLALCGCDHAYVVARIGPPPLAPYVVGPVGVAPGLGYIWIDGYWDLRGGVWVWAPGRWVIPPRGRTWVAPRWEPYRDRYRFRRGGWR